MVQQINLTYKATQSQDKKKRKLFTQMDKKPKQFHFAATTLFFYANFILYLAWKMLADILK